MARPKDLTKKQPEKSSQIGTKEGEERFSFVAKSEYLEDMKNIAHWGRLKIKDVYNLALSQFIETWKGDKENKQYVKGGKITQRPEGE